MPQHQLPPVARNDFLHPIEADFGELKADWRNSHFNFVFQCYLGFCEGFLRRARQDNHVPTGFHPSAQGCAARGYPGALAAASVKSAGER